MFLKITRVQSADRAKEKTAMVVCGVQEVTMVQAEFVEM
jgi:hypothetical protein